MHHRTGTAVLAVVACLALAGAAHAGAPRRHEAVGFQLFASPQANPIALSADGSELYVAHTTANQVVVIRTATLTPVRSIPVGVDPVSVAVRPGGQELWVSNHVSDTVSIIDVAAGSPTRYHVIDTVQAIDADGVTSFDEPVGIAFREDGARAYVALSSRNQIAVVDATTRAITSRLNVRAQDPRALAVRNGLLYVAAFESGNQSELSACPTASTPFISGSPPQCTLGAFDLINFATNPNLPGSTKNIVIDPQVPDRDLFVFDTATNGEVAAVSGIGTLLYGLAVSSSGRAFITQTDARNAVNGIEGQNLIDLDNRMFTNELAAVTCTGGGCGAVTVQDLEGPSPTQATALATPYGVALSGDDSTLVLTAAGTSRLVSVNASTLATLDVLDLGTGADAGQQIPRGVALRSGPGGAPQTAYVLNTLENTVSVVDVSNPSNLGQVQKVLLIGDPTPAEVRRGRIAFNSGFAASNGTFSCASCHPDGNIDQLLWRIGGACFFGACTGDDEPRSTMPIRGLKNTLPLHWDGTLGDPFGGRNGAVSTNIPPSCDLGGADGDHDCFRHLVDASLSGVMCEQSGGCASGPSGLPGELGTGEREDMAFFLASVVYPPARSRRLDDTLSTPADPVPVPNGNGSPSSTTANALTGFQDFFTNQGGNGGNPDTCADSDAGCHELPLGAGTNSATLAGFDVPTMRGMTDRFINFSLGVTNPEEVLTLANSGIGLLGVSPLETPIRWSPTQGMREITTFGSAFTIFQPVYGTRPLHMFQMFEEASTGFSGAQARQVQLNQRTTGGGLLADTDAELLALELADQRGLVNLQGTGLRNGGVVTLSYRADGTYKNDNDSVSLTHAQLIGEAQSGALTIALTASLRDRFGSAAGPQPLLDHTGTGSNGVTGDPPLPVIPSGGSSNPAPFTVVGTAVRSDATVLVDGAPVSATLTCSLGTTGDFCNDGNVSIDLAAKPPTGLRMLQVQNPRGPLSNELPICIGTSANCN